MQKILLRQLLISLKEQYESKTYDVNGSVRTVLHTILTDEVHQATKKEETDASITDLQNEMAVIAFCLAQAPGYWVELLVDDEIES